MISSFCSDTRGFFCNDLCLDSGRTAAVVAAADTMVGAVAEQVLPVALSAQ
jgi:hypothetical protein